MTTEQEAGGVGLDLDALQAKAEAAKKRGSGSWVVRDDDPDWRVVVDDEWNTRSSFTNVALVDGDGDENIISEHIAAADPDTVLELIRRLRNLEEWAEADPEGETDTAELRANWHGYNTAQYEVLNILAGGSALGEPAASLTEEPPTPRAEEGGAPE